MGKYICSVYSLDPGLAASKHNIHVTIILIKDNRLDGPGLLRLTERMTERLFPIMREQQTFLGEQEKLKNAASPVLLTAENHLPNNQDITHTSQCNLDNLGQATTVRDNANDDPSHADNVIIGQEDTSHQPSNTNHDIYEQDVIPSEEHEEDPITLE